jgi:predicted house-cleaning NTP pyrophosphatase (Maf/HAM1 superfamily)
MSRFYLNQREEQAMNAAKLRGSITAVFTAVALATASGHVQELEEVNQVFEHAIPNIPGKSLVASL